MDKKIIQAILEDALEEQIPSSQVNLWPAVKADLVAGKRHSLEQVEEMKPTKLQRIPSHVFIVLIVIILLIGTLITPQGRSFAQDVLNFFIRAEDRTFPLRPSHIMTSEPNTSVPTASAPMPLMSIAEAEAQAGFHADTLPFVPEGFKFLGARLYGETISIEYETQNRAGHLVIQQSQEGFNQSDWDKVPADAIIPVKVGELEGEFTQGTFVVYPGETQATWNPNAAILRLRWVKDGVWFQMAKFGDVEAIEYLDQAGLVELAESLVSGP